MCVLLGIWCVDCMESYVIGNMIYMLCDVNFILFVFIIVFVGLGYWVLGGYIFEYYVVGKNIGVVIYDFLDKGDREGVDLLIIFGNYIFDIKCLYEFKLDLLNFFQGVVLVNKIFLFYEQYKYWVIGVVLVFMFLIVCFLIVIYYIICINYLKYNLEVFGEELLVVKEKVEEFNRLKMVFLVNMSYEICIFLNVIVGFFSVLVSDDFFFVEKEQYCDIIQKNFDLLLYFINDILDILCMEFGRIKFVWEECDVVELCQMVLFIVEYGCKISVLFLFEIFVFLLVVKMDVQCLKQVLINLLFNVVKFILFGFIKLMVVIDKQYQQLELLVLDIGCGILFDKSEKVFECFEKLNEYF